MNEVITGKDLDAFSKDKFACVANFGFKGYNFMVPIPI
jgi:hypothetical protein